MRVFVTQISTAWILTWWCPPDLSVTSVCLKQLRPTDSGSYGLLPSAASVTATFTSRGRSVRRWGDVYSQRKGDGHPERHSQLNMRSYEVNTFSFCPLAVFLGVSQALFGDPGHPVWPQEAAGSSVAVRQGVLSGGRLCQWRHPLHYYQVHLWDRETGHEDEGEEV